MYKSILLAADGSENSFRAAEESLNFIDGTSRVTILNVLDAGSAKDDVLHSTSGMLSKKKEKLAKITSLYEEKGIDYKLRLERGEPKEMVVKIANSGDYEAVVLGTRGLNSLQEMMLGSVSHKVAKRSDIPVIIVK